MVVWLLTFARAHPMPYASVGWTAARANAERWAREESPGSMDIRCRITSGGRKLRDSATENRPPLPSLPRGATQTARQTPPGARPNRDGAGLASARAEALLGIHVRIQLSG